MVKVGNVEEKNISEILYDRTAMLRLCGLDEDGDNIYTGYYSEKYNFFYKTDKPVTKDEQINIYEKLNKSGKIKAIEDLKDVDLLRISASMKIAVCKDMSVKIYIYSSDNIIKEYDKDKIMIIL